jgi:hypothetical protein
MIPSNLGQNAIWSNIGNTLSGKLLGLPPHMYAAYSRLKQLNDALASKTNIKDNNTQTGRYDV